MGVVWFLRLYAVHTLSLSSYVSCVSVIYTFPYTCNKLPQESFENRKQGGLAGRLWGWTGGGGQEGKVQSR